MFILREGRRRALVLVARNAPSQKACSPLLLLHPFLSLMSSVLALQRQCFLRPYMLKYACLNGSLAGSFAKLLAPFI